MLRNVVIGFVVFLVVGNGLILASMAWFQITSPGQDVAGVGIDNVRQIDERVFRGAGPDGGDYADLAALGITTVVDLRAEANDASEARDAQGAGLERVHLPVRDGQIPTAAQVETFLQVVEDAPGPVFVHCGAGVGRAGSMSAAYLNLTGQTEGIGALRRNLAIGPPSFEQIVFSVETSSGEYEKPGPVTTAVSRVLDSPRRIWHNLT